MRIARAMKPYFDFMLPLRIVYQDLIIAGSEGE